MVDISAAPVLPGYRDLTALGRGGYSEVYRAYQEQFDRWVAVKLLTFTLTDDRAQQRFLRECRVAGRVSSHPNVVTVYDAGISPDGRPYIAMELYEHGSLSDRVRQSGPFPVADALRIGVLLAGALESAHRAGVVHRDVKPGNVMLAAYGQPALTDFGLSIVAERQEVSTGLDALSPHYAPPESLDQGTQNPVSDVYSLAATVYAMLAGRAPHQAPGDPDEQSESLGALLNRIVQEDVPPLDRRDVPDVLQTVLRNGLARDPEHRTPTALLFAQALQTVQRGMGLEVTHPVVLDAPPPSAEPAEPPSLPPVPVDVPIERAGEGGAGEAGPPASPDPAAEAGSALAGHPLLGPPVPPAPEPPPPPLNVPIGEPAEVEPGADLGMPPPPPPGVPPPPPVPLDEPPTAPTAEHGAGGEVVGPGAPQPSYADPTLVRGGGLVASPEPEMYEPPPPDVPPAWPDPEPGPPPLGEETMHRERLSVGPPHPLTAPAPERRSRGPLVAIVLLLVATLAGGIAFILVSQDDDEGGRERADGTTTTTDGTTSTTEPAEDEETSTTTSSTTAAPAPPPTPVELQVTGVTAPPSAPDGFDACQNPTTFGTDNLVDHATDTAWRMPGDGTGQSLTITLDGNHRVLNVGLVPGYAKVDPCDGTDRFTQNRRPTRVTWTFDDGTEIVQPLRDVADMQTIEVDARTNTIQLTIDGVTGNPDRNFTAISEIAVLGT